MDAYGLSKGRWPFIVGGEGSESHNVNYYNIYLLIYINKLDELIINCYILNNLISKWRNFIDLNLKKIMRNIIQQGTLNVQQINLKDNIVDRL